MEGKERNLPNQRRSNEGNQEHDVRRMVERTWYNRGDRTIQDRPDYGGEYGFDEYGNSDADNLWDIGGPYRGIGPRNYQRSDKRIYEEVCQRLADHPWLDASNVEVEVEEGEVTLSGTVPDRRSKYMAEEEAEDIPGVREINNNIRISP